MKRLIYIYSIFVFMGIFSSCEDQFLQMPNTTGTLNLEKVYSDSTLAIKTLVHNYHLTFTTGWGGFVTSAYSIAWFHGNISAISGEIVKGQPWHANYVFANTGPSPVQVPGVSMINSNDAQSIVPLNRMYNLIRSNYLVIENIDNVPNMTSSTKAIIKAESKAMNAYSFLYLMKNYGGVPLVRSSLLATDAPIKRSSLKETFEYIISLCDQAISDLPVSWPVNLTGRLTKSAVLTMKAEAYLIAARPLFNSDIPYIEFGSNNDLICFGTFDPTRWNNAITSGEAALAQARAEGKDIINTGGAGAGLPNPNAVDDYGTATSTPNNNELILSCHNDESQSGLYCNTSYYQTTARYNNQYGVQRGMFTKYYKSDGTDQDWPKAGDDFPRAGSDYVTRFKQMEPRFQLDLIGPGIENALGNPGVNQWSAKGWTLTLSNRLSSFPNGSYALGCAMPVKFYYKAGNRLWYEYPIFRVAELYLQLAEAYNEVGNTTKALENLNVVHNRAGLPAITEVNKDKLRQLIQREWDIEFFNEGKRYYNYREWKIDGDYLGGMYGPVEEFQFQTLPTSFNLATSLVTYWSAITYTSYWNPKMYLEPFPQGEVNKGTITQNPGY